MENLKNIMNYDSFKMNESNDIKSVRDDVWQQDVYYSTSGEMSFYEFIEIEVNERQNYTKSEVNSWLKKYGVNKNDTFMWVAKTPAMASRYHMSAELWNGDKYIKEYEANTMQYNVESIPASKGVIITESDDGDWGALMVMKSGKDRAVCLWNYMKNKLEEFGGFDYSSELKNHIDDNLTLKDIEKLIKESTQNFVVISNFKYLGGVPVNNIPVPGGVPIDDMIQEFVGLGMHICRELSRLGVQFKLAPQYGTYTYNDEPSYYVPELSWFVYSDSQEIIDVVANISTYPGLEQESIIVKDYNRFGIYSVVKSGSGIELIRSGINFDNNPDNSNLLFGDELEYGFSRLMLKNGKMDKNLSTGHYGFKTI